MSQSYSGQVCMHTTRHRQLRAKERQTHMPCQLPRIATDVGNVWWACFDKNDQQGMQEHIPFWKKMTWPNNISQCNLEYKLLWIVWLIYYETLVKVWHFSICADVIGVNLSIYWNDWYDIIMRENSFGASVIQCSGMMKKLHFKWSVVLNRILQQCLGVIMESL